MIEQLSPGIRKFAALGLLAGLLLIVGNLTVAPVVGHWRALDEQIEARREEAARLSALAAVIPQARSAIERGETALNASVHLAGETEAIQLANLQIHVVGILQRAGVRPQSTRTLATVSRDGIALVGLQLVLQADIARTRDILHRLEAGPPRLLVDAVSITPANRQRAAGTAEDLLQLDIRVLAAVHEARKAGGP